MALLQLALLALIQGLTEFIPVSSSAHLILPAKLIEGFEDQGTAVDVAAHVGSLGAVVLFFRTEVARLFQGARDAARRRAGEDRRLFLTLVAATVPFLIVAPLFALSGLADAMRSVTVIAWASIAFGALLWLTDRMPARLHRLPDAAPPALLIGAAQCLALIPGTSRSGITITAARAMGYDRTEAARFSMLMSIPAIGASGAYLALDIGGGIAWASIGVVAALSFASAYAAIGLFLRLTRSASFTPFVAYRVALGIILLLFFTS